MSKKLLTILAVPVAMGAAFGVANFASAQSQTPAPQSSVKQDVEKSDGAKEVEDTASLQTKATLTSDQAKKIAETNARGSASAVRLEDENGTVVYSVTVGSKEVKVDAVTGNIVASDNEANDAGDIQDKPDTEDSNH